MHRYDLNQHLLGSSELRVVADTYLELMTATTDLSVWRQLAPAVDMGVLAVLSFDGDPRTLDIIRAEVPRVFEATVNTWLPKTHDPTGLGDVYPAIARLTGSSYLLQEVFSIEGLTPRTFYAAYPSE